MLLERQSTSPNAITDFDQMITQLRDTLAYLQDSVNNRTRDLEIAAEVSRQVVQQLDLDKLLPEVSLLTRNSFDLYHVHIYLLDNTGEKLALRAGAGDIGQQMVAEGRTIELNNEHSLVASAARQLMPVLSNNVHKDPHFLPHPLLLETQAELAIPMVVGDELIGVLDVQASQTNRFTDHEVRLMSTLAGQIATAVRNARLYDERLQTEARLQERAIQFEAVAQVSAATLTVLDLDYLLESVCYLTQFNFNLYHAQIYLLNELKDTLTLTAGVGEIGQQMVEEQRRISLDREHSLVARAARTGETVVSNDVKQDPDFLAHPLLTETASEMAVPLFIENEMVGILDLQDDKVNRFTEDEIDVMSTLASQIGVAIRNAQLYEERRRAEDRLAERAAQLETVAQVSAAASTILDLEALLKKVSELTRSNFDLYHAHIYLYNPETQQLVLRSGAGDTGTKMVAEGRQISIDHPQSIVANAARSNQAVISNDVRKNPNFLPHPLLPETRAEMALPLLVADNLLGVLDVQADTVERFGEEDVLVLSTLAQQVAVAVQNARAYEAQLRVAEQLREVDRLKSEFLANMSHELRTPLNSIIGYSEVLLEGIDGELSEEAILDVEDIHSSGKHLLAIINDILDLAKLEAGHMNIEARDVSLHNAIDEVVHSVQVLLKDKPIKLSVCPQGGDLNVAADPIRLRQIILNLVSNAIKFTETGSVEIHYGKQAEKTAFVKVIDTGIGIDSEGLRLIFERFSQVDGSTTRRSDGTGLGLTITRELVHLHGGEIFVDSNEGEGSTFWFTLPLS